MIARTRRWLPWLLGFLLTANLYLIPSFAQSPRATDVMGTLLALWVLYRLGTRGLSTAPLAALAAVNILPLAWFLASFLSRQTGTMTMSLRWLLAIPWALALPHLTRQTADRGRFLAGLLWGIAVNVGVVVLQGAGLEDIPRSLGLSTEDSAYHHFVYHSVRIPGLHGHHAASSAVVSLVIPATLYLYFRGRAGIRLPALGFCGLLATVNLTSTRSPLIVSAATVLTFAVLSRRPRRTARLLGTMAAVLLPVFLIFGPPGGKVRWQDAVSTEANFAERLTSTATSALLSVENPFGCGVRQGQLKLIEQAGIDATHNAFLQASLFLGLPLALAVFAAMVHLILRSLRGPDCRVYWEGMLAWHLFFLFLFEEHLNNPTFVILASWFITASVTAIARGPETRSTRRVTS